jgi:hypothetical protein
MEELLALTRELKNSYYFDDRLGLHPHKDFVRIVVTGCDEDGLITFFEVGRISRVGRSYLIGILHGGMEDIHYLGDVDKGPTPAQLESAALALADICDDYQKKDF